MAGFNMYEDLFIVIDIQTAPGRYVNCINLVTTIVIGNTVKTI